MNRHAHDGSKARRASGSACGPNGSGSRGIPGRRNAWRARHTADTPTTRGAADASVVTRRWIDSFRAAGAGLRFAWLEGRNLRVQVAAGYAAFVLAAWLGLPAGTVAAIAVTTGLVLATEVLNTAVEVLVDLVTREYHPLAGLAKDLSAGAVLFTAAAALVVAGWAFLPNLGRLPSTLTAAWQHSPTGVIGAGLGLVVLIALAAVPRKRPAR